MLRFSRSGIMLGFGVAFLREMLSGRVFLTSKSVQSRLRIACVGLLPKVQQWQTDEMAGKAGAKRRRLKKPRARRPWNQLDGGRSSVFAIL